MGNRILLTQSNFQNPEFDSPFRREGLAELGKLADLEYYSGELGAADTDGVVGVIANSVLIHPGFYRKGKDLRIVSRWGVGYENVNLASATENGVMVTIAPEHMVTVAEYAIAQWMAALKRVYTLNRMAHGGEVSLIRTYEADGSVLGLYGMGRIGQAMAERARPLLGKEGRLLVYDIRPDIGELAARFGPKPWTDPRFSSGNATPYHCTLPATTPSSPMTCSAQCSRTPP